MNEYNTDSHLNAICTIIAEELEAHANGRAYTDEDGNLVILDSDDEPTDDMEYRGLYDLISDAFDVKITRGLSGDYRGAKLYMTVGGPAIWIDTQTGFVEGRSVGYSCSKWVDSDAIDALNEEIEELIETR